MSELFRDFNKKYNKICETFDDLIEEGDFAEVEKLVNLLLVSKIPGGCIHEILKECMDTAYRATKIEPPVEACFKMVEYFKSYGIPVPTYEFYGKRINK